MLTEVEGLVNALRDSRESEARIGKTANRLVKAAARATRQDRSEAVARLSTFVRLEDSKRSNVAATVCGALVEMGADPAPMEEPVVARLLPALRNLAADPVAEPPEAEPISVEPPATSAPPKPVGVLRTILRLLIAGYKLRRALKRHEREEAAMPVSDSERVVKGLIPAALAMFSASPSLRAAHPEVRDLAKALSSRVASCDCLHTLFGVLEDEPFLVIEPSTQLGMLARLSGVDVNFTLTMLLMHHFPGPAGQPLSRLSAKAASVIEGGDQQSGEWVTGVWNLYTWLAPDANGSLPEGQTATEHWIWNEGSPAEIPVFEGRRVVLLGPPAYLRNWPADRTFAAMRPELRIERILTPHEVQGWLDRMNQARPSPPLDVRG